MKPAHNESILVTDDESNIRMMVRTALESEGYVVREAANGREALASIARSAPDLIVLDLNMPELDGMAVLEQMKTLSGKHPRVVVLTAYGSIPAAVKALHMGANDFIQKPVTPADLRKTVRAALDEPDQVRFDYIPAELRDSYEHVLDRIRKSFRLAEITTAETLLMKAADRRGRHSAEYFNLLGVLYETQHNWRLARKCYSKSIEAEKDYVPALANMQRLRELETRGHSTQAVVLGDEPADVIFARLPDTKD
jgi:DNA-binding response OmpR family regulator